MFRWRNLRLWCWAARVRSASALARLLARAATVRVGSRQLDRAEAVCRRLVEQVPGCQVSPHATGDESALQAASGRALELVVAAGGPGVTLLDAYVRLLLRTLRRQLNLNAVPPPGIVGIKPPDRAADLEGVVAYAPPSASAASR